MKSEDTSTRSYATWLHPSIECLQYPESNQTRYRSSMTTKNVERIELANMIEALREELSSAIEKGKEKPLRFELEAIDLEVKVTVSAAEEASGKTKAGFKFWIFAEAGAEAGGSLKRSSETVQTLKLRLLPRMGDKKGNVEIASSTTGERK